jgi:hypothetical protein
MVRTPRTEGSEWISSNPQPLPPMLQRTRPTVNPPPSTTKPSEVHTVQDYHGANFAHVIDALR